MRRHGRVEAARVESLATSEVRHVPARLSGWQQKILDRCLREALRQLVSEVNPFGTAPRF